MISVGRRDGRKEMVGLGFGGGGGGGGGGEIMEDTELEEGEACSYHHNHDNDNHDDDFDVDPDIALSYINPEHGVSVPDRTNIWNKKILDEKLQDVLGHFQKDFEGGVSAENLGAKFGGYGSFLPTYQRSPVWSHPRTPPKTQHSNVSRSPNNSQMEGGRRSSVSSSNAPLSVRLEHASSSAVPLPVSKTLSSLFESGGQAACMPSAHVAENLIPRSESINKKSVNLPHQKMLKVRIKVGSDNLSTRKNAAIYSGLGLDISPSSSLDESPSESEGMSQDDPFESPAHILQVMTSFPVLGDLLLSPLSDELIHLKEKEKLPEDTGSWRASRAGQENSGTTVSVYDSTKGDGKVLGEKKIKSLERKEIFTESKSEKYKDSQIGTDVTAKKGTDNDTFTCEELIPNTSRLPPLTSSHAADTTKGNGKASNVLKGAVRGKCFSGLKKEEPLVRLSSQENGSMENSKSTSAGKVSEDKKASSLDGDSVYPRKDGHHSGEKLYKVDSNVEMGRKQTDLPKHKSDQKALFSEHEGLNVPPVKEHSSSEGKKKTKGSQSNCNVVSEAPKESLKTGSSSGTKSKKSTSTTKVESEDFRLHQSSGKAGDRYREFFGDIELEQEESRLSPLEMKCDDKLKDSGMVEKSTHHDSITSKDQPSGKNIDKMPTSESLHKASSNVAGEVPKDNWVACDKCQKWRLLPLGLDPSDLPENWMCSMLYWLPSRNRCSVSEDETTNIMRGVNQSNPGGPTAEATLIGVQHPDQNHQNIGLPALLTGGKKKHGLKELSTITHKDGSAQLSNTTKKIIQASARNGGLNGMNPSPMVCEADSLKLNKSGDLATERRRHKPKEKHKVLDSCSDGGGSKRSKMNGKRDVDQDCPRSSKKMRSQHLPEDWISDHGVAIDKVGPSSSNGLATAKHLPKYSDRSSSKDTKNDPKNWASTIKPKEEIQVCLGNGSMDMGKDDNREASKKRKLKESHDALIYLGHLQDAGILAKEEFSENEFKKDKKARTSRSGGKEASTSKGSGRLDKKSSHRKVQQLGQDLGTTVSQRSLDGVDSLKRDSRSLHPSVTATSSSSKVSGSHKTKSNLHDSKGSPVESVSSSPMRVLKPGKLPFGRKNLTEKDDAMDAGFCAIGVQRQVSEGDDDVRSDRYGTARKENGVNVSHHGTLESCVFDFREMDSSIAAGGKAKAQILPSPDIANHRLSHGGADRMGQDTAYASKSTTLDRCHDNERQNENHHVNGSRPKKSGKGSSSRSKDKNRNFNPGSDNDKIKISDSVSERTRVYEIKLVDGKHKIGDKSDGNENRYSVKKKSGALLLSESKKQESQPNVLGHSDPDVREGATCNDDTTSTPKKSVLLTCEAVTERGKSLALPPSGASQNDALANLPQPVSGSLKGNGASSLPVNVYDGCDPSKAVKQSRKLDHADDVDQSSARNSMSNGNRVRDLDAPSPVKRDCSSQSATHALKEAKSLKHAADRLKGSGAYLESIKIYFEAAVQFLYAASLLESCSNENAKTGEMALSMHVYSSTAKLCEFCAHEYEKSKDMAAAALAYKCAEVAYMRVINSSHANANRDRHELQTALQLVPPGESPSSSASDIDNLNHPTATDKVSLAKSISSPQVTGSHIIASRSRPSFVRLLNFAQDVNFAMEASRKSRSALAAVNVSSGKAQDVEAISSIKAALNYAFQDVEGLLRLVKLAIEAISR